MYGKSKEKNLGSYALTALWTYWQIFINFTLTETPSKTSFLAFFWAKASIKPFFV